MPPRTTSATEWAWTSSRETAIAEASRNPKAIPSAHLASVRPRNSEKATGQTRRARVVCPLSPVKSSDAIPIRQPMKRTFVAATIVSPTATTASHITHRRRVEAGSNSTSAISRTPGTRMDVSPRLVIAYHTYLCIRAAPRSCSILALPNHKLLSFSVSDSIQHHIR